MLKNQTASKRIIKRKRGNRVNIETKVTYKKTMRRKAAEIMASEQQAQAQRAARNNAFHLPEFGDYDSLWYVNRKDPITLMM